MKITRRIAFEENLKSSEMSSIEFINILYSRLAKKFPAAEIPDKASTVTIANRVERCLKSERKRFSEFVKEAYKFIEEKKVTHYISAISLGAAVYRNCTATKSELSAGAKAGASLSEGVSLESRVQAIRERGFESSEEVTIGRSSVKDVKPGVGEGVVEYELLPISALLQYDHKRTKEVLQKALIMYIECE